MKVANLNVVQLFIRSVFICADEMCDNLKQGELCKVLTKYTYLVHNRKITPQVVIQCNYVKHIPVPKGQNSIILVDQVYISMHV